MNSVIITFICTVCLKFRGLFAESGIYRGFDRLCRAISNEFHSSIIIDRIYSSDFDAHVPSDSITYKTFDKIFSFFGFLNKKLGEYARYVIDKSIFVTSLRKFLHTIYALNIRVLGVMLAGTGISAAVMKFVLSGNISYKAAAAAAVGVIVSFCNKNIADFLNYSAVIKFITDMLGLDINFAFYKNKELGGKSPVIISACVGVISGCIMAVNIKYGLIVPFAVFFMTSILSSPVVGVYTAVFAAPFVPTMALAGICILTTLSLIVKSVYMQNFRWKFESVGLGLMLLLLVFFITSLTSFAPANSLKVWALYFVFMNFYFVLINSIKNGKQLDGLLKTFVISGAFVALYGIMQYVFGWNTNNAWIDESMFEDSTMRVYSTLENPNVLGEYLLLVLPVSAVFIFSDKETKLSKFIYAVITLGIFVCLILTQSRGCWLGFMLAAMIFVTFRKGRLWGLLPIVLLILPFVVPETIVNRLLSIGDMGDSSTSYRVFIWMGTLAMLRDFWVGGIGMGEMAFNSVYPFYSYNAIIAPHSHNLFLQLVTESGIAALVIFVVTMVIYIKNMMRVYSADKRESGYSMTALALISGVMAFMLESMTDYTFYNYRVMAVFFMYLALGMTLKYFKVGGNFHGKNS